MNSKVRSIVLVLVAVIGCHRHASDAPEAKPAKASNESAAQAATGHNRRVFVTESSLPRDSYVVIDELEVGKSWYGSVDPMLEELAAEAQKKGADAVIEVKTWHRVTAWSWAAPHASGKAVRFKNPCAFDPHAFPGQYLPKSGGAAPVTASCNAAPAVRAPVASPAPRRGKKSTPKENQPVEKLPDILPPR